MQAGVKWLLLVVAFNLGTQSALAQTPAPPPPTPATQSDVEQARTFLRQANLLYSEGKYKEALPLYERVYRLYPTPNTMFNLAQTHRQLKSYEQAIEGYRTYLTMAP